MKLIILLISTLLFTQSYAQAPNTARLAVFETCMDELQGEITRGKKVMIKDFNLKIRQKDILVYGPYAVSDQYFKVDYVIFAPTPSSVTVEFELHYNGEGNCSEVRFHDYVY